MNNISFGQYVPGNSWIYKLDPRMKILITIALIVLIFIIPSLYGILIALGVFVVIFLTTRIPAMKVLKGLKPILFLLLFTFVLQLIYTTGSEKSLLYSFNMQIGLTQIVIMIGLVLLYMFTKKYLPLRFIYLLLICGGIFLTLWFVKVDFLKITDFKFNVYSEGVSKACFIFVRIILMIGLTSLLTLTTMTTDINNGLESLLSPLKLLHINPGVFAMLISLTLRFIPTLMIESTKIMNSQASRGVDFSEGSLKDKVNQIISLLIPMFVISFKRAEELSDAMEARGYIIGEKRTKLDKLKLRFMDYFSLVVTIALFAVVIWCNFNVQI